MAAKNFVYLGNRITSMYHLIMRSILSTILGSMALAASISPAMGSKNITECKPIKTDSQSVANISSLFDSLRNSHNDSVSFAINDTLKNKITILLNNAESFDNQLSALNNLGKCYSDDHLIRIYSWAFPLSDKTYHYECFIQYKSDKQVYLYPLTCKNEAYQPQQNGSIDPCANWYGALYYKAVFTRQKKAKCYTLLGWAGNDATSDYKIIETLWIDAKGKLTIGGKNIFDNNGVTSTRILLKYSNDAKVGLDFQDSNTRIVFDHLVPSEPTYKGIYSYYGPDFTYDGYEYLNKKGIWEFVENIDAKNKE